jgi:hypothetical protein
MKAKRKRKRKRHHWVRACRMHTPVIFLARAGIFLFKKTKQTGF